MTTFILVLLLCALVSLIVFAPLWRGGTEPGKGRAAPGLAALESERNRFVEELRSLDIALAEGKLDPHGHAGERLRVAAAAEQTLDRLRRARAAAKPEPRSAHGAHPRIAAAAGVCVAAATVALAAYLNGFDLLRDVSPHVDGSIPPPAAAGAADASAPDGGQRQGQGPIVDENGRPDIAAMVARLEARVASGTPSLEDLTMLARSYHVLGRTDDAVATYRRALEVEPGNVDVMMALGMALFDSNDRQRRAEAEPIFDRILAVQPEKPEALWFKSLILVDRHEIGEARKALVRLAALVTDNPPASRAVSSLLGALQSDLGPARGDGPAR